MFGLDESIAGFSDGTTLVAVLAVALLLGLRHASDPDHLAALATVVAGAGSREDGARSACTLAFAWGLGHATTLVAFGIPIVLWGAYLPERIQQGAETAVGILIVTLAVWLLLRWHRGVFHDHAGKPTRRARTRLGAYGIGLIHGMGGTAGVGILLLTTIESHAVAVVALAVFALFTAVSMAAMSTGFGLGLSRVQSSISRIAPVAGTATMAFGVWYALGALELAPYWF
jgi:cytochrome c biogenesis protein CcdA